MSRPSPRTSTFARWAALKPLFGATIIFGSLLFGVGSKFLAANDRTLSSRPLVITRSSR